MKFTSAIKIVALLLISGNLSITQTPIRIDIDLTRGKKPVSPFIYGKNNDNCKNYQTNYKLTI
jgi:hypothetical protein